LRNSVHSRNGSLSLSGFLVVMNKHARSALVVAALALAGCGASDNASTTDAQTARPPSARATGSPLPAVTVDNLITDTTVSLDSFIPASKPTLVWFWAPH
jgi:hypothetical protein